MMKKLLLLVLLNLPGPGDSFLEEVSLYSVDSYFKDKVYSDHNYKSFFQLKEANQALDANRYDMHLLNAAVFFATNQLRDKKELKQLQFAPGLRNAAVVHSYQMVEKKFFDHFNNKTRKLRSPDDRIKLYHTNFSATGENIDYNHIPVSGKTSYAEVGKLIVDDFFHSAPHKKIMMNKLYNQLGCAVYFETKPKDGLVYFKATQNYSLSH